MRMTVLTAAFLGTVVALAPMAAGAKVGGGDVEFKPKGTGVVVFKHETHVNYKGFKCADCHYKTFQMGGTSYKIDMSALTKGAFCGKCHDGKKAFDVKDATNCTRCHKE
ncbi:MAG: cytochrome c3 family protein [Nitrospirota bacterium]